MKKWTTERPAKRDVPGRRALAREFGRSAGYYQEHARLQKAAARRLIELLEPRVGSLPPGPILEVGCGTGFVSHALCRIFPGRALHLTDLSEEMVRFCAQALGHHGNHRLSFSTADGECWGGEERYAVVVAAFVAQWFHDPAAGLRRLADALLPEGLLLVSLPIEGSFTEWRRASEAAGEAFAGERLPCGETLAAALSSASLEVTWTEESFVETFGSPLEFFQHLKRIGAANRSGREPLPAGSLRRVLRAWERRAGAATRVSYRVLFLAARRTASPPPALEPPRKGRGS